MLMTFTVDNESPAGFVGEVTITRPTTTTNELAPLSVRFGLDLTGLAFDTPAPVAPAVHDARKKEITAIWNFGDPGDWDVPVNVLPQWLNRNKGLGHDVAHVYRTAGPFTVTVLLVEHSSGKWATGTLDVPVNNPDTFYAGTQTVLVKPAGDSDTTGESAYPGADVVSTDELTSDASWWTARQGTTAKRYLCKAGAEWNGVNFVIDGNDVPCVTFGRYGTGANPIWNAATGGTTDTGSCIVAKESNGFPSGIASTAMPEVKVAGIDMRGNFDPTTTRTDADPTGKSICALWNTGRLNLVMVDSSARGFMASTIGTNTNDAFDDPLRPHRTSVIHLDNCYFTDLGGQYPLALFNGWTPETYIAVTGGRITQNPLAPTAGGGTLLGASRSLLRVSQPALCYIAGCDWFATEDGWHPLEMVNTPQSHGSIVNIHSITVEGGDGAVAFAHNALAGSSLNGFSAHNALIDGLLYIGAFNTAKMVTSRITGLTIRNAMCVISPPAKWSNSFSYMLYVGWHPPGTPPPVEADPDIVPVAPVEMYGCTLLVTRTRPQNSSGDFSPLLMFNDEPEAAAIVTVEGNLHHMPNLDSSSPDDPITTWAPISETPVFVPRTIGRKSTIDMIFDPTYATPEDAIWEAIPLPTSTALNGVSSGKRPYLDITGEPRLGDYNAGTIDRGAWQVS